MEQVLAPARIARRGACAVRAAQFHGEVRDLDRVRSAEFQPVDLGWRWGPKGSTAWFRLSATLPGDVDVARVRLAFSSGTEALLWRDFDACLPWHGLDANRDEVPLWPELSAGQEFEVWIEAACNHPLGSETFFWDAPEVHARWAEARPGRLERAEWIVPRPAVHALIEALRFAGETLDALGDASPRARRLIAALEGVYASVRGDSSDADCERATAALLAEWRDGGHATETTVFPVGHAHLDTAWLWPISETRRKALRTFSSALHGLETFDGHRFLATQPQQLAWVREDAPELFERIEAEIHTGRWQARGAMWIEPDGQVPTAESFCRQLIHGQRFLRDQFNDDAAEASETWVRTLFLPDTFGFNPGLPQVARLGGIDLFVTNKLWWSEQNTFPHVHFLWRGLDGTELLSHLTPGQDYNAKLTAEELRRGVQVLGERDRAGVGLWLQPYGFGDGGGGPSDDQRQREAWISEPGGLPGLPAARSGGLDAFRAAYLARVAELRERGRELPVWDSELYLELHRGTLTSQARLKQKHGQAERALRALELAVLGAPLGLPAEDWRLAQRARWERLLVQQFHDILPGSGVRAVVQDAERELQSLLEESRASLEHFARQLAGQLPTAGLTEPLWVFNPSGTARSGCLDAGDGRRLWLDREVPAWGWCLVDGARLDSQPVATARLLSEGAVLENEHLRACLNANAEVEQLLHKALGRDAVPRGSDGGPDPLHAWELFDDHPRRWEAWDLDEETLAHPRRVDSLGADWQLTADGCGVRVKRAVGARSWAMLEYRLEPGSRRLEIDTQLDWQEERTLLRARFPVDVRARQATFEVPGGWLQRPTTRNTSVERAAFEVPVQRAMDLSEPGFGLTVLNAFRYGASAENNVLGLSLLRATRWPDADAERGEHRWRLALEPHAGVLSESRPWAAGEALADPLIAVSVEPGPGEADHPAEWSPFEIERHGAADPLVQALAPGWRDGVCLRLAEAAGGRGEVTLHWKRRPAEVALTDLLEQPCPDGLAPLHYEHDLQAGLTRMHLRPFQLVTLRARFEA